MQTGLAKDRSVNIRGRLRMPAIAKGRNPLRVGPLLSLSPP